MEGRPRMMRIGELGRRVGVSTHVLRAWEARYGLLRPTRSTSGYRLYGPDDEDRIREVLRLRNDGIPASEAADHVLSAERAGSFSPSAPLAPSMSATYGYLRQLREAVDRFDEPAAHAVLDALRARVDLESVIADVLLPFLRELGDRWERPEITVAHEHFASQLIRRRLAALASTWATGTGPVAVLACPPGERHDIPMLCFGVLLGRTGWRIRYLGQDTPIDALTAACDLIDPDLVVLASTRETAFEAQANELTKLADRYLVAIAGRGSHRRLAQELGTELLPQDVVEATEVALSMVRPWMPAMRDSQSAAE